MNRKDVGRRIVVWVIGGCLLGGCRKAGEVEGGAADHGAPKADGAPLTVAPKAADGSREAPSKLARGEGRKPDGRKAPAPSPKLGDKYIIAVRIPGKPGSVFNPYTNNPVDVRGIPAGTLVRDPQDPDPNHKFRIPAEAPVEDDNDGRATENPVPQIP